MPKGARAHRLWLAALVAVVLVTGVAGVPAAGALTVPSAPRTLVVTAGPGAGAVSLAWVVPSATGGSPITNYGAAKSTDGGVSYSAITYFGSTALSASSASFPFLTCANTAPGGVGCRYRVFARNAVGTSVTSNTVISWVTPGVPGWRRAAGSAATQVRLSWVAPPTTGGFALRYGVWSGTTLVTTTTSTSAIVSCATPRATRCSYGIDARDPGGLGFKSAVGAVNFLTAPGAPSLFAVANSANDYVSGTAAFHLSWQPPKTGLPPNHYEYQSCQVAVGAALTCSNAAFVPRTGLPTTVATSADTICSGVSATCGYRVRGVNALGIAGVFATNIYGPSAPFSISAQPGATGGQVSLSFSAPAAAGAAGPASYVVRECPATANCGQQSNWQVALTVPAPASSPLTVPCPAGTSCRLRLEYVDGAGATSVPSPQATTVPVNRPCTQTISAPTSISGAESAMTAGGVLCLNAGVYTQAVSLGRSGTATASITVESTPGQHAILDGTGLALTSSTSVVAIAASYVDVLGVELRNSSGRGMTVSGSNVTIAYSTFHDMKFNALVASGSNDLIQSNEAYNTVMSNVNDALGSHGWAEAMNTWYATNATFRDNYIHDNWGEGINFINSVGSVADGNTVMNNFSVLIYNGNSKNSTITDNQLSVTNTAHSRSGFQVGVLLAEEGCVQEDSNIMISNNNVSGGTIGVGYWWTGCGGVNNSYDHVTIAGNTVSSPAAIQFDKVGAGSPAPVGNATQGNTTSGTISIGQPSGWTMS